MKRKLKRRHYRKAAHRFVPMNIMIDWKPVYRLWLVNVYKRSWPR